MEKLDRFFILSNPLYWVYFIVLSVYYIFIYLPNYLGLQDWYFVLFNKKHQTKEYNKKFMFNYEKYKHLTNQSYTKRKAWEYLYKKLKKDETCK